MTWLNSSKLLSDRIKDLNSVFFSFFLFFPQTKYIIGHVYQESNTGKQQQRGKEEGKEILITCER